MQQRDADFPASAKDMDAHNDMKQVMASRDAILPQVPYRRGMYMKASKVVWFVDFMDTFCHWRKMKALDGEFGELLIEVINSTEFPFDASGKNMSALSLGRWSKHCPIYLFTCNQCRV